MASAPYSGDAPHPDMKAREKELRLAAERSRMRAQQHREEAAFASRAAPPPADTPVFVGGLQPRQGAGGAGGEVVPASSPPPPVAAPAASPPPKRPAMSAVAAANMSKQGGRSDRSERSSKASGGTRGTLRSRSAPKHRGAASNASSSLANRPAWGQAGGSGGATSNPARGHDAIASSNPGQQRGGRTPSPASTRHGGRGISSAAAGRRGQPLEEEAPRKGKPGLPEAARANVLHVRMAPADDPQDGGVMRRLEEIERANEVIRDQLNVKARAEEGDRLRKLEGDNYALREQIGVLLRCHPLVAKAMGSTPGGTRGPLATPPPDARAGGARGVRRTPSSPSPNPAAMRDASPPGDYMSPQQLPPPPGYPPPQEAPVYDSQGGVSYPCPTPGGVSPASPPVAWGGQQQLLALLEDTEEGCRDRLERAAAQTLQSIRSCALGVMRTLSRMDDAAFSAERSLKELEGALASAAMYEQALQQQQVAAAYRGVGGGYAAQQQQQQAYAQAQQIQQQPAPSGAYGGVPLPQGAAYAQAFTEQGVSVPGGLPIRTETLPVPVSPEKQTSVPHKEKEQRGKRKKQRPNGGAGGGGGDQEAQQRARLLEEMRAAEAAERDAGAQNAALKAELERIRRQQQQQQRYSQEALPQSFPQQPRSPMPFAGQPIAEIQAPVASPPRRAPPRMSA